MKKIMLTLAVISCNLLLADTYVNGYTKSDGTYVQGHYRSSPDSSTFNNYSTKGNTNPYTGEKGYKDPYSNSGSSNSYGSSSKSKSLYGF